MSLRPRPSQRCLEGLQRLRNNTDFTAFREHLQAELDYFKDALVTVAAEGHDFAQFQGRAQQLVDLLKHINPKE